jgi:hypothetical protein
MAAQGYGVGAAAQLGAGGGQTSDGGSGQLCERRLSFGKAVVEHGQFGAGLDDPTPGEMGQDANPHDLQEVADLLGGKAWQRVEDRRAGGLLAKHSIHEQTVPVWIQLQIRVAPLHDGDGAALTAGDTLGAHTPPVEPQHRIHEDSSHGGEYFPVIGQAPAQLEGQR